LFNGIDGLGGLLLVIAQEKDLTGVFLICPISAALDTALKASAAKIAAGTICDTNFMADSGNRTAFIKLTQKGSSLQFLT